jgi:hypothetical protein
MFKKYWPYITIFACLFIALTFFTGRKKKEVKWHKTFRMKDDFPFGASALYQIIETDFFPANVKVNKLPLVQLPGIGKEKKSTYFFLNSSISMEKFETKKLLSFVENGNKVFCSANQFYGALADTFKIQTEVDFPYVDEEKLNLDTVTKRIHGLHFLNEKICTKKYSYDKFISYCYFSSFDTSRFSTVAADDSGRVVCIHAKIGKGDVYFCSLPDVFTNYYIVNHPSRFFAYQFFGYLKNEKIFWDESYKYYGPVEPSPFRFMIENDSLYYAFWTAIIATLFFMFSGMRRTQRPVPLLPKKSNTTLQFIDVIGNVYFNADNHKIIAEEKIMVFLDILRSKFQIKSSVINQEDILRISRLSGVAIEKINELITNIQYIYSLEILSEKELISFNKRLEEFYKYNLR